MFCCKQRGRRREGRERWSQADGRNKWRQSVEEVRGSDKLSTARRPKPSSQSIIFSPPLLSVCLIDFFSFLPVSWKPDSNDYSGFFWSEITVRKTWWFVSLPNGWTVKASQKFYPEMPLFRQASNIQMIVCRLILLGARSKSYRKMAARIAAVLGVLIHEPQCFSSKNSHQH